jgi:hypothetical protein
MVGLRAMSLGTAIHCALVIYLLDVDARQPNFKEEEKEATCRK